MGKIDTTNVLSMCSSCGGILMSLTYTHKFLGINKHFNGNNHLLMAFLLDSLFCSSLHAYYRVVSSRLYLIHLTLQKKIYKYNIIQYYMRGM